LRHKEAQQHVSLIHGTENRDTVNLVTLQDELVRFWNESAEYYVVNSEMNATPDGSHPAHVRIAALLNQNGARTVLDVGCGTGHVACVLSELAPKIAYTGVDVSSSAIGKTKEIKRPGTYLVADTAKLPFDDADFDAVISLYALEHFTDPKRSLQEVVRVTRPGGVIGIYSMNYDRPLGTVSSVRLGLRGASRLNPANIATYAINRSIHALRQIVKHVGYAIDPTYLAFEMVEKPLVLEGRYDVDFDAVHVVSGRSVVRVLEQEGCEILSSNVPRRLLAKRPVGLEIFARRHD
jgi:ubiquinone/menaquinone biosynthesis C-methylase UbiE